jgi:hypothetical protein
MKDEVLIKISKRKEKNRLLLARRIFASKSNGFGFFN